MTTALKPSTNVEVSTWTSRYHRPNNRHPQHFGKLLMRLDDAQKIARPCLICFPEEDRDER